MCVQHSAVLTSALMYRDVLGIRQYNVTATWAHTLYAYIGPVTTINMSGGKEVTTAWSGGTAVGSTSPSSFTRAKVTTVYLVLEEGTGRSERC